MMDAVLALAPNGGLTAACDALGASRASVYRRRSHLAQPPAERAPRPKPPRALTPEERRTVLDLLREPRFADLAPTEIYATLLDEGIYHCSIRTMYRILDDHGEVRERRDQLRHPVYSKPELLAEGPNQVWSWDNYKADGASEMDLLLPVRHSRHLQPLGRRLVRRRCRERQPVQGAVR
ncbi:hypothetical protein GGE65_007180 [Skermanella aerolata]